MKTTYYTNTLGLNAIANGLTELLGTKEETPTYSLGFQRYLKLSRKVKVQKLLTFEYSNLISLLENMTETEFKNFKK